LSLPIRILLGDGVCIQDVIRGLQYSGLAVSNTMTDHTFAIKRVKRVLPANVIEFEVPATVRLQAD
jgi:hypothetical protein